MEAQGNISSEVYRGASFNALRYFEFAYLSGKSILSTLREKNGKFGTMLRILEEGTKYATYLESIVKPLERDGLLSCSPVGYCTPTDEGKNALNRFNNAASRLDTILGSIDETVSRYIDLPGMEAYVIQKISDDIYVIQKGTDRLKDFIFSKGPFIPTGKVNPFIEAFIRAKGEPHDFTLQIASLYHPLALLLTAKYIIECETYCKDRYPTGEKIKKMLKEYTERYNIPKLKSPLQALSAFLPKLIDNYNRINYKRSNRYRLTDYGKYLAKYIALHILLS
jgi:Mn-dependent DtxR family transcriptional regulator